MRAATLIAAVFFTSAAVFTERSPTPAQGTGWILGEDAETRQNPKPADPQTLADGKTIYKDKCARCHGTEGLGDGPEADPAAIDMDLTNPKRAGRNPDGVLYYKVLNGRARPQMPAFKDELTEQQIWAVVIYAQTLRKK